MTRRRPIASMWCAESWRTLGRPAGVVLRPVLVALVIAGLLGMHQLMGADDCCSSPPNSVAATGPMHEPNHALPAAVAVTERLTDSTVPVIGDGAATAPSVLDLLGMCLALAASALGGLALALLGLRRTRLAGYLPAGAAPRGAASPRGPPLTRRLAQLQVLRL